MAEKRTIELEVKESGFKSLKAQIKEANIELIKAQENFGDYSQEAIKAAKNVAGLKDKIAEASETAALFDPGKKFQVATGAITAAAGAMSAYEGAMGLVGVESEQLEKTMLKVQSAMALSQGLSAVADARKDFARLGAVVGDVFSKMTAASKAFMVGGIGLLIAGVSLLVANWDNLTASSNKAAEEQKKLAEETKKFNEESKETTKKVAEESSAFVSLVYQLKATNANSKERSTLMKEINSKYGTTLKNLSDENEFQAQLNKSVEEYIELQYNKLKIEKNQESFDRKLAQRLELEEKQNKLLKVYREERFKEGRTITQYNYLLERQETITLKADETLEQYRNRMSLFNEDLLKVEDALQKNSDATEKIGARREKLIETDSRLTQGGKVYVEQVEKSTKATEDNTDAIDKNAKKYEEVGSLKLLTQEEHIKTSLDLLKEQVDAEALINKDARDKALAADKAAADAQIANAKAVAEQKAAIQMQGLDVALQGVQLIKGVFEQQKGIQKAAVIAESAIGIAKMIIANKLANVAALATPQAIATSGAAAVPVIALNNISTGIGIAANIAATGKALKTLGGGTAPTAPSTGGGGGGGVTAPNFNIVGNSGINQLAELGGQPIQAYVVSGEVTSAQALDRNRIQNASF